ncbi:MAG: CDP-alcohol phosphatidyltransferase family protein [Candidatus Puniceispirillales bacterium WSBS_2018_MAG_OTU23]
MLDSRVRPFVDIATGYIGRQFAQFGLTANMITLIGAGFGILAFCAIATGYYGFGLAMIVLNRLFDGIDGAVARHFGATDLGGYLDIVADFIFYSIIPLGFAIATPEHALAATVLIFSFVGTGSSFLAFAIMAEKNNISTDIRGKKSIYYLGGLTEGTETIAVLIIMCIWPQFFHIFAYSFALLCGVTTVSRIYWAYECFGGKSEKEI